MKHFAKGAACAALLIPFLTTAAFAVEDQAYVNFNPGDMVYDGFNIAYPSVTSPAPDTADLDFANRYMKAITMIGDKYGSGDDRPDGADVISFSVLLKDDGNPDLENNLLAGVFDVITRGSVRKDIPSMTGVSAAVSIFQTATPENDTVSSDRVSVAQAVQAFIGFFDITDVDDNYIKNGLIDTAIVANNYLALDSVSDMTQKTIKIVNNAYGNKITMSNGAFSRAFPQGPQPVNVGNLYGMYIEYLQNEPVGTDIDVDSWTGIQLQAPRAASGSGSSYNKLPSDMATARGIYIEGVDSGTGYYGIDIDVGGGTYYGIRNKAKTILEGTLETTAAVTMSGAVTTSNSTIFTPRTAQAITAAATAITITSATVMRITSNANYTLSATPTIANGTNGQTITIVNVDTGTDVITLQDQGTLASSNLRLSATTVALGPRDSITLMYSSDVGDWVQISSTNVL